MQDSTAVGLRPFPTLPSSDSQNMSAPPPPPSPAFFGRLKSLLASFGPETNKHDRVIVLIAASILEGIDTSARIIGTLVRLGFNNRHVAIMLKEGTGTSIELHRWRKGADGRYTLIS